MPGIESFGRTPQSSPDGLPSTAVANLARAILLASFSSGDALKPYLDAPTQQDKHALYPAVCYEFVYFFAHLMNRFALSILGNDGRATLQNKIGPLIVVPAIAGFFDHWPQDKKEQLTNDFYHELDRAELDYSMCRDLWPASVQVLFKEVLADLDSSRANNVVSKLISRIFTLSRKSLSPEAITLVFDVSTKAFAEMDLQQQIESLKKP
jgi:hypothetical protein